MSIIVLTAATFGLTACGSSPSPVLLGATPTPRTTTRRTKTASPTVRMAATAAVSTTTKTTAKTARTRKPTEPPITEPPITQRPASVYYASCAEARAAGAAPLHVGDPGYRKGLDRDGDGVACES